MFSSSGSANLDSRRINLELGGWVMLPERKKRGLSGIVGAQIVETTMSITDGEEKGRESKLKCRQDRGGLWTSTWEPKLYRNSLVARDLDACALGQCFCTNENPPYTLAPRKRSATKFPAEAHPINSSASLLFHPHHRAPGPTPSLTIKCGL